MQRLVLAVIIGLVVVAVGAILLRATAPTDGSDPSDKGFGMDKLAYGLLLALIVYVSLTGGA